MEKCPLSTDVATRADVGEKQFSVGQSRQFNRRLIAERKSSLLSGEK